MSANRMPGASAVEIDAGRWQRALSLADWRSPSLAYWTHRPTPWRLVSDAFEQGLGRE